MNFLGKNHIGYQVSALGNHLFFAVNPTTENTFSTPFTQATPEEVSQAILKDHEAFEELKNVPLALRLEFIAEIIVQIKQRETELLHWFCAETALPRERAESELKRSIYQFEYYAKAIENGYALEVKQDSEKSNPLNDSRPILLKKNIPLGPVVVFGASNFPFAYGVLGGDVASALLAACPVLVKAHAMHPHTSSISAEIIIQAAKRTGMPEGTFSHLLADDFSVGELLVKDLRVKAIGFTGSIGGGMALQKLINERTEPIPLYAEMGSSNPIVVTQQALEQDGTRISMKISDSVALNAGQFCTSPGLLLLVDSLESTSFIQQLKQEFEKKEAQCMLHPVIAKRYRKRVEEQRLLSEMLVDKPLEGSFIKPGLARVYGDLFIENQQIQEEVFGSFLTLVVCKDEKELDCCIASLKGQLTASIFKGKTEEVTKLIESLSYKAGRVIIDGVPTGVEVSFAQQHGGPFPSSSTPYFTSVGWDAVKRFLRPVAFQFTERNSFEDD